MTVRIVTVVCIVVDYPHNTTIAPYSWREGGAWDHGETAVKRSGQYLDLTTVCKLEAKIFLYRD